MALAWKAGWVQALRGSNPLSSARVDVLPRKEVQMRRAIATVCLSGVLNEKLAAASAAGFDAVELFENDLVTSFWGPERVRERADDLGLAIDLYQPFRDLEAVPPDVFDHNLRRAEHKFD